MAIVGAVVLLVTLLALGGFFLYRSLPGTSVSATASETAGESTEPSNMGVLYVRVVGESSDVFVRIPGGDVLMDQNMSQGQSVNYATAAEGLEVTIGAPAAVEVFVDGDERDISDREPGFSFTIDPQDG
ncbi:RodZ domain-containing protein [Nocardiopsis sp. TNDT3]|uniref:RodZ domain-containing protein n=1 Tax=Nocardiopsis sp. TNDT3 TaxID=2249354 RepID=UPI000E3CCA1A|nr:RodZ domain-containing protein [Nocardiopsis sp. TNDT3]